MATNQVIHGSNRVVENPNRYILNAVSGQTNTYDLEKAPGEVTEVGTPYSKAVLDKIDNVLSYLTPSLEKVPGTITESLFNVIKDPIPANSQIPNSGNVNIYSTGGNGRTYLEGNDIIYTTGSNESIYFPETVVSFNVLFESGTIQGSNDNSNWNNVSVSNYKVNRTYNYYRYPSFYLRITKFEYAPYSNKFTLDNNGNTFVNNQRVLVETPQEIIEYEEKTCTFSDMVSNVVATNVQPLTTSLVGNFNSSGAVVNVSVQNEKANFAVKVNNNSSKLFASGSQGLFIDGGVLLCDLIFDTPIKIKTFKTQCATYDRFNGGNLYFYKDNVQVETKAVTTTSSTTYNFDDYVEVDKIRIGISDKEQYNYSYVGINIFLYDYKVYIAKSNYDGITSNTLNGIDIPTLLQPSTKYELIYNESNDEFKLGGLQTLFDITLTEDVNQVEFSNLKEMLKIGKVYALIINGKTDLATNIAFTQSGRMFTYSTGDVIYSPVIFSKFETTYTGICGICLGNGNSYTNPETTNFSDNILRCDNSSRKFKAGTRIIIKEVA